MDLRDYLLALRRHLVVIILLTLLGVAGGVGRYMTATPIYTSNLQFYVSTPLPEGGNAQAADQFAQNRVNSYVKLFGTEEFAERVVAASDLELTPADISSRISAAASVGTIIITVKVSDTDPERVVQIADAVAETFGPLVEELDNVGRTTELVQIRVVTPPSHPTGPSEPSRNKLLVLGFGIGAFLGVAYAVIRELLDGSVRSERALAEASGYPTIGRIPASKEGTIAHTEALRKTRTALLAAQARGNQHVLLVTSARTGDGETTVATGLAGLLVRPDEPVVLVDADIRNPGLAATFDIPLSPGLADVLAGKAELDEALVETPSGLWVLPAGTTEASPADLLSAATMAPTMAALRERFTRVVIAGADVLSYADGVTTSVAADEVVLVVKAASTDRRQIREAVQQLETVSATIAGLVLNEDPAAG